MIPSRPSPRFPAAWAWFFDEALTEWVKTHYSPRESWKGKPFNAQDAEFFSKGITELSELFVEERSRGHELPAYFHHPKYRSSYLLYFFPLQAAKFLALYREHPGALEAALAHGRAQGELRVADLGAGPGTASLAFLLWLLDLPPGGEPLPPVRLHWWDLNGKIMNEGRELALMLTHSFPRLRGKVEIETHVGPWWKVADESPAPFSLTLMGHVLNEAPDASRVLAGRKRFESEDEESLEDSEDASPQEARVAQPLLPLLQTAEGGGLLIVEPAERRSAQLLSKLRDELVELDALRKSKGAIWGPCLHAGRCPLAEGRDWCHFSAPVEIPGNWFRSFSKELGSERHWLKYSYLWLASRDFPAPRSEANLRRVVSDPLGAPGVVSERTRPSKPRPSEGSTLLVCEPERVRRVPAIPQVGRGDLYRVRPGQTGDR